MSNQIGLKKVVFAAVAAVACAGAQAASDAVAFYDFSDGTAGAAVGTVKNLGTLGGDADGTAGTGEGGAVTYSDDVPGLNLYTDRSCTEILSGNWKSVEFTVSGKGGYIKIPGLGDRIALYGANGGAFTVEFFAKVASDVASWTDFCKFWHNSSLGGEWQEAKYVVLGSGTTRTSGIQISAANPIWSNYYTVGEWHHFALVYSKGASDETGSWTTYVDGVNSGGAKSGTVLGVSKASADLYLGADGRGAKEWYSGKLTAFRVTDRALTTDEFMTYDSIDRKRQEELGGVLGLWTFAEGEADESIVGAKNEIDPTDPLVGLALGTSGAAPIYSDDAPGKSIRASRGGKVLVKGVKSAKFAGSSDGKAGSGLKLAKLSSRIASAGAVTLEFFCKFEQDWSWRNVFAMVNASESYFKLASRTSTAYFVTQFSSGEGYATLDETLLNKWHHVAFTWDAASKKFTSYIDYKAYMTRENTDFSGDYDGYFGCKRNAGVAELFNGKIACVRLMPKCLAPEEMMVASPAEDASVFDSATVFYWGFEEATATDGGDVGVLDAIPEDLPPYSGVVSHYNSQVPTYSKDVYKPTKAYSLQNQDDVRLLLATNGFCARFYGYSEAYDNMWAGSHLEQKSVRSDIDTRPESFTLEMFVRRDVESARWLLNCLFAGFGASGVSAMGDSTDWYLAFSASNPHSLWFNYHKLDGTAASAVDTGINFEDGKWHHFAISYEATSKTVRFYLDYELQKESVLEDGLQRTTGSTTWRHCFGRGFNASGFNGWMDDIRLSSKARQPGEFIRKDDLKKSGLMILIR